MKNNLIVRTIGDTVVKIRKPLKNSNNHPVILMLHGYTGDEDSMWVFSNQLSEDMLIISPRAPFKSKEPSLAGFSWVNQSIMNWPVFQDFFLSVNPLEVILKELERNYPAIDFKVLNLVGFSQGGAMAVVFASATNRNVQKIALLSSFLPDNSEGFLQMDRFANIDIFIGHGKKDQTVPVDKALYTERVFRDVGANTNLCISDVGHQLGSECFKAFGNFIRA